MFHACTARFDVLGTKQGLMSKPTFFIKKKIRNYKTEVEHESSFGRTSRQHRRAPHPVG